MNGKLPFITGAMGMVVPFAIGRDGEVCEKRKCTVKLRNNVDG